MFDELLVLVDDVKGVGVIVCELGMVKKLIDDMLGKWIFDEYYDMFCDDIFELVECKVCVGKIEEIEDWFV